MGKKLSLNKTTISTLAKIKMYDVQGGRIFFPPGYDGDVDYDTKTICYHCGETYDCLYPSDPYTADTCPISELPE